MGVATRLMTAEELLKLPDDGFRYELVDGELRRMSPAGHHHGRIAMRLAAPLTLYVEEHDLGEVYAAETGFLLTTDPDTVRAPDIAFVSKKRARAAGDTRGYFPGTPDLAVEVNSPGDTIAEIEEKVETWLEAGTKLLWVVSPKLRVVMVYRSRLQITTLTENAALDGEEVVPGFRYEVARIFR